MTPKLGIDHPLILVRDLDAAITTYGTLGFTLTPIGKHPWGTSTSVAIMDGSLVELMSVYDQTLLDEKPAGAFRFGRYIQDHLAEREGISLLALHSEDAVADAAEVESRGVVCQGSIEFGRDVVLPDGRHDRTATTLKIVQDAALPRLSNFICHQHRPDLIYVPKWREHANKAAGYAQVTIIAAPSDQSRVRERLAGLYGADALSQVPDGFAARTGQGSFVVYDRGAFEHRYGALPPALAAETQPFYAAIHIRVPDLAHVGGILEGNAVSCRRSAHRLALDHPERYGNVFLNFTDSDALT